MTKRVTAIVHGRVQGVTFREFTKSSALRLGLVGFVRNLPDGTVEIAAEGEEHLLKELLRLLREEHPYAKVERIDERWSKATGEFDDFRIR